MSTDQDAEPYVDPEMRAVVAAMTARTSGLPDYQTLPPPQARALFQRVHAHWNIVKPPMVRTRDIVVPGPRQPLPARLYHPRDDCFGLVVYLHGGGWVLGDVDTHDRLARMLALAADASVLSVGYRLAPEHPFPEPLDDVVAVLEWIRNGSEFPLARRRLALAGDSAGANLALAALLDLRDRGEWLPAGAALFYGAYDQAMDTPTPANFDDGRFGLTRARMRWYWDQYLGGRRELAGYPRASPLRASLYGLPPLFVNAASLDPLLHDSVVLCEHLGRAGVAHQFVVYQGVIHGFMQMSGELAIARRAFDDAGAALRRMLAG